MSDTDTDTSPDAERLAQLVEEQSQKERPAITAE